MGHAGEFCVRFSRSLRSSRRRVGLAVRRSLHPRTGRGTDCARLNYLRRDCESCLIYLPALGAVHPCVVGKVDSAKRAFANGRLCICWRAIRNRHLDAAVGAFSRVWVRRRLAVK